ncbi:TPA: hypothetical protein HA241_06560 [Candidatus Woesearchaeota archaeon]|nr:hypothetical protein [Candidatus Woesearchaeota archaeon]
MASAAGGRKIGEPVEQLVDIIEVAGGRRIGELAEYQTEIRVRPVQRDYWPGRSESAEQGHTGYEPQESKKKLHII